jgi:hypothetical protein
MAQSQYRAKQFAEMCGISKQRISELVAQEKLAGIHLGRDLIIDVRDPVNRKWIEERAKIADGLESLVVDLTEQEDDDEDLFTAADVEELLRKAFKMVAEDAEITLASNADWKIPAKIATAARAAKRTAPAIERALNAFTKRLAADLAAEGERFIKAWRDDELEFFLNGPTFDEPAAAATPGEQA